LPTPALILIINTVPLPLTLSPHRVSLFSAPSLSPRHTTLASQHRAPTKQQKGEEARISAKNSGAFVPSLRHSLARCLARTRTAAAYHGHRHVLPRHRHDDTLAPRAHQPTGRVRAIHHAGGAGLEGPEPSRQGAVHSQLPLETASGGQRLMSKRRWAGGWWMDGWIDGAGR